MIPSLHELSITPQSLSEEHNVMMKPSDINEMHLSALI